jgi:hypothetical protein
MKRPQEIEKDLTNWCEENKITNYRIQVKEKKIEFRYRYWKYLPPKLEQEIVVKFGFKLEWIDDPEGWTNIFYEKQINHDK